MKLTPHQQGLYELGRSNAERVVRSAQKKDVHDLVKRAHEEMERIMLPHDATKKDRAAYLAGFAKGLEENAGDYFPDIAGFVQNAFRETLNSESDADNSHSTDSHANPDSTDDQHTGHEEEEAHDKNGHKHKHEHGHHAHVHVMRGRPASKPYVNNANVTRRKVLRALNGGAAKNPWEFMNPGAAPHAPAAHSADHHDSHDAHSADHAHNGDAHGGHAASHGANSQNGKDAHAKPDAHGTKKPDTHAPKDAKKDAASGAKDAKDHGKDAKHGDAKAKAAPAAKHK